MIMKHQERKARIYSNLAGWSSGRGASRPHVEMLMVAKKLVDNSLQEQDQQET